MNQFSKLLSLMALMLIVYLIESNRLIDRGVENFVSQVMINHSPYKLLDIENLTPDRLVKKNNKLYLFYNDYPLVENINPVVFNNYSQYTKYCSQIGKKCLKVFDQDKLKTKKAKLPESDPFETYQRRCNRIIGNNRYINDVNFYYGNKNLAFSKNLLKNNEKNNDELKNKFNYHENYDIEKCMEDLYLENQNGLKRQGIF